MIWADTSLLIILKKCLRLEDLFISHITIILRQKDSKSFPWDAEEEFFSKDAKNVQIFRSY